MRLRFQNIGIIEEAEIEVNGITLIAGQNDSGKSTVGKILYALVRGMNIDEGRLKLSMFDYIVDKIKETVSLLLRQKSSNNKDEIIRKELISKFLENKDSLFSLNFQNLDNTENLHIDIEKLKKLYENYSNESIRNQIQKFSDDIINLGVITSNSIEVLKLELQVYFENELDFQIQNKFNKNPSFLEIDDFNLKKITFDETFIFEGFDKTTTIYKDVIFFESPVHLNYRQNYNEKDIMLRDKNIYLNSKITQPKKEQNIFSNKNVQIKKFHEKISKVVNGEFLFNSKNEIVYKKGGIDFNFRNIATGIKTFGAIQLLLEKNQLNSNTLLIIDEPEVHLHPTWQVKFAEILVILSKEFAIPMVLTSHSPYFIEALEAYTKKYKYEDSTNFYFAEKNENGLTSKIVNVNGTLSKIYSSISEASYKLREIEDDK